MTNIHEIAQRERGLVPSGLELAQDPVKEMVTDAINAFLGRTEGRIPVPNVSHETGISERTLHGYKNYESSMPGLLNILKLMARLPPAFANRILAIAGLGAAIPIEPSTFNPNETMAIISEQLNLMVHRNADGYDAREVATTGPELERLALELLRVAHSIGKRT